MACIAKLREGIGLSKMIRLNDQLNGDGDIAVPELDLRIAKYRTQVSRDRFQNARSRLQAMYRDDTPAKIDVRDDDDKIIGAVAKNVLEVFLWGFIVSS